MRTWSHSSKNTYITCPRQYDLQYNKKVIPYQETEATIWGNQVHSALEHYAKGGAPLTENYVQFQPWVDKILALPGEKFFEQKLALTRNLTPAPFEGENTWCRAILDALILNGNKAGTFDYKTGKIRTDTDQLKLCAGIVFQHYPEVETVKTAYLWLKHGQATVKTYTRGDVPEIWAYFMAQVKRMEDSYERDKWVPKPSGLCNGWCGAGRDNCEFWSPRR